MRNACKCVCVAASSGKYVPVRSGRIAVDFPGFCLPIVSRSRHWCGNPRCCGIVACVDLSTVKQAVDQAVAELRRPPEPDEPKYVLPLALYMESEDWERVWHVVRKLRLA